MLHVDWNTEREEHSGDEEEYFWGDMSAGDAAVVIEEALDTDGVYNAGSLVVARLVRYLVAADSDGYLNMDGDTPKQRLQSLSSEDYQELAQACVNVAKRLVEEGRVTVRAPAEELDKLPEVGR